MGEPGRPVRSQGIAGTWPVGRAASAGGLVPAGFDLWTWLAETLCEWARAEAGAGRLLPWVPVAFGGGIALYFAADHEPVLWVVAATAIALMLVAVLLRRSRLFAPAIMIAAVAAGFAMATWKTARIAHTVLAKPLYSVSLSGFVETRDIRERTDRFVLRVTAMEAQRSDVKLERVRLSVRKGTAPEVGSFVQLKARLMPPLSPVRPGSYDFSRDMFFQGIGASGFVMGAIAAVGAARRWRVAAALCRLHAGSARCDRRAHPRHARGRQPGDRDRAAHGPARCDHHARQRRNVHLGARTCALDFRLSHGGRRRRGLLCGARAAGVDPWNGGRLCHQEMVRGRRAGCSRVLSAAVRRGGRHAKIVLHDRGGADRGHGRSPCHHLPHAGGGGADRARGRAGGAGASELPDVVRGDARTGGAGADRHAEPVRVARSFRDRADCNVGRARNRDAVPGLADRGARDHALCRLPLPPRHPVRRARQPRGDAGGLGPGDARGPVGFDCSAVRT